MKLGQGRHVNTHPSLVKCEENLQERRGVVYSPPIHHLFAWILTINMMPRKKKNGSRGTSPESEKSLLGGVMGDTVGQYGSESGIWSEIGLSESSHVQKAENEKKFQYLQEAFKGKVEPDVVYMILSESEWKGIVIILGL